MASFLRLLLPALLAARAAAVATYCGAVTPCAAGRYWASWADAASNTCTACPAGSVSTAASVCQDLSYGAADATHDRRSALWADRSCFVPATPAAAFLPLPVDYALPSAAVALAKTDVGGADVVAAAYAASSPNAACVAASQGDGRNHWTQVVSLEANGSTSVAKPETAAVRAELRLLAAHG